MSGSLIGRRDELLAIESFVSAVPRTGHALVLTGDAGIGKTELWQAGVAMARAADLRVLSSRSSPAETRIAFATLSDLFTGAAEEAAPGLPALQRRALERAFLVRESDEGALDTRLLCVALTSVVRSLASHGPVLLAIDDAQWVDPSSAEILRFVLRRSAELPVGVLMTARALPADPLAELQGSFAQFRRLRVAPMSAGALHSLLWDRLELAIPRPALMRLHAATGGNAFFALEIGRGIVDGTIRIDGDAVPLPESLLTVVAGRLDALPRQVAETLVAVAALASPTVSWLAPLGGTTVDDLEFAASRDVIVFDGDRIRFSHPLLAPACYELLPLHRRRDVHRRLAELDLGPEERARHLALATAVADRDIAATLDVASVHARARGAVQAAADLAKRALDLTPAEEQRDTIRRRSVAARLCAEAGDLPTARTLLEQAVGSAPAGPQRARAILKLAEVRGLSEGNPVATDLVIRALAEPDLDAASRAQIYSAQLSGSLPDGDADVSLALAENGLALAEELGDPETLVTCLSSVADMSFWCLGTLRRDLLERAIRIQTDTQVAPGVNPRSDLAYRLGRMERFEESRAMWTHVIADSTARDDPDVAAHVSQLARMEVAAGRWDVAERGCAEAIELSRQTGREITERLCVLVLTEIDAYRGDADPMMVAALVRDVQPASTLAGAAFRLGRALASLQLSVGDASGAWAQLEPWFDGLTRLDEPTAHLAGSAGVEALVGVGDLDAAHRLLGLLHERALTAETPLGFLARRNRGLILAARGDLPAAIEELEAAAIVPDPPAGRNPLDQARTLLALGRVHREAQHKKTSRDILAQALRGFEELGARTWAERTRGEMRRIGGRASTSDRFTETEQRIVELVVAGRRNREVADALFLSPDTVAWNLSRVYKKLGISSRTQLAALLSDSRVD